MSLDTRDLEAFDLLRSRAFSGAYLASFALDLQARRLTAAFYGALRGGDQHYLGTVTFYGAAALTVESADGAFPDSARIASLDLSYDDEGDMGQIAIVGRSDWTLAWSFDGVAYEEHAALIASLADEP